MATYLQEARHLTLTTPLGPDVLLLRGLSGDEAISDLFRFELDLVAENGAEVPFGQLLGQKVSAHLSLPDAGQRHFSGICSRISQGARDATFTYYRMEVVPAFWFLTRIARSRIFQQKSVPDILREVLAGLIVSFDLQGTFHPRDYCVQYRETDFHFASRLMEEEGIFYFFKHSAGGHEMVVTNTPQGHPELPEQGTVEFELAEAGRRQDNRITSWEKVQELRPGKYTLWDHCFELPHKHLEAETLIQDGVQVGEVLHELKIRNNEKLEIYDYPGQYAQRFDGIDPGGFERPGDLEKVFEDNRRTVGLRMQEEAASCLLIRGAGFCRHLVAGHTFQLRKHFDADGAYVVVGVHHRAELVGDYRSDMGGELSYENSFTCIPTALPFRPRRVTPRPVVNGTQTAVVVGPAGEEIFTDKYGRVKVQFPWDREGKRDEKSSCWVRVGSPWAGKNWGAVHIPRIGQEVIVAFEEGDPDRPIIVGSVYNAEQMPPFALPNGKVVSGIKSESTPGGGGYNEMTFDDTKGKEKITVHGQYDMATTVEHDHSLAVHNDHTSTVDGTHTETVKKATTITITEGPYTFSVRANTATITVKGDVTETYQAKQTTHVTGDVGETYDATQTTTVKDKISISSTAADIEIDGKTEIKLISGSSSLTLKADGTIELSGKSIKITGTDDAAMGVGNQSVTCDKQQVATSGAAITSAAVGKHEISGALVKIN